MSAGLEKEEQSKERGEIRESEEDKGKEEKEKEKEKTKKEKERGETKVCENWEGRSEKAKPEEKMREKRKDSLHRRRTLGQHKEGIENSERKSDNSQHRGQERKREERKTAADRLLAEELDEYDEDRIATSLSRTALISVCT